MSAQEHERSGWLTFAAILMFAVGFVRIVSAIRYFDDGQEITNLTAGLFGDSLWAYGIWDLSVAALALFGGWSLLSGGGFGRSALGFQPQDQALLDSVYPWFGIRVGVVGDLK